MVTLVVKRIGFMIFTMIIVSLILFLLLETDLTGDPAARVLGQFSNEEQRDYLKSFFKGISPGESHRLIAELVKEAANENNETD